MEPLLEIFVYLSTESKITGGELMKYLPNIQSAQIGIIGDDRSIDNLYKMFFNMKAEMGKLKKLLRPV